MDDLSIIIPTLDEDHETLQKLFEDLTSLGAEVIIIDDGSKNPFPKAVRHQFNMGYGEAIITGIKLATRPLVLMMDGDGQHQTSEAVRLYHAYKLMPFADMVIGTRRLSSEKFIRFLGRKFLNFTASLICTKWISDLNSGARIFKRDIAYGYISILCRTFSFTTSLTISMMADGYKVEYFPIKVEERKNGKSKVKLIQHGLITLKYIFWVGLALRTRGVRKWLRKLRGLKE